MKKDCLLKESYTSYVFWILFVIALFFYFALHVVNTKLSNINYLLSQKNQLETTISKNSLEITTMQNFIKKHSATLEYDLSSETFARILEKLLQQYSLADDCLTIQQNGEETLYILEDTTDYFLLQSFLLDLCKSHANVTDISMKAEGELVHFIITILK